MSIGVEILGVIGGFGGGVFLFPLLIIVGFPPGLAAANSLVSLFLPSVLASVHNFKRREINFRLGIGLEIPTAIGTILGANLTVILPSEVLHILFGFLSMFIAYLMFKDVKNKQKEFNKRSIWFERILKVGPKLTYKNGEKSATTGVLFLGFAGGMSGLLAGMFGVGAGWIKTPLMILGFEVAPNIASATATFMIIITSAVGGFAHFVQGSFDIVFIPLTLGLLIGAEISSKIRNRINREMIVYIVIVSLLAISITMFLTIYI